MDQIAPSARNRNFLTKDQELALLAKREDLEARNELIVAHGPLLEREARRFIAAKRLSVTTDELVSVAIGDNKTGLIRAIQKFDPAKGCRLSTYAVHWIREALRAWHASEARRGIRAPRGSRPKVLGLGYQLAPEPDLQKVDGFLQSEEDRLADFGVEILFGIAEQVLNERDLFVFRSRCSSREFKSLAELGAITGLTGEAVRQIELRAIAKVRANLKHAPTLSERKLIKDLARCIPVRRTADHLMDGSTASRGTCPRTVTDKRSRREFVGPLTGSQIITVEPLGTKTSTRFESCTAGVHRKPQ